MSRLVVDLNRGELYDVQPAVSSFESTGPFEVELRNHGQPVHVHLRLDEDLSRVASLSGTNHYVEGESALTVPVAVAEGASADGGRPPRVRGMLKVVTGYGSGTDYVEVHVSPRDEEGVDVDEDLGRPAPSEEGEVLDEHGVAAAADRLPDRVVGGVDRLPDRVVGGADRLWTRLDDAADRVDPRGVLVLGAVVAVAVVSGSVALLVAPGLAVVFGIFAVLIGLAVAGYLLAR